MRAGEPVTPSRLVVRTPNWLGDAVMALPAVAGKFGVRGGGFSMSNSSAWGIKAAAWMDDTPEPQTRMVNMNQLGRALTEYRDPPVEMLFVYNCNPLATMPVRVTLTPLARIARRVLRAEGPERTLSDSVV